MRQIPGERKRRWFSSPQFDLIVWLNRDNTIAGFELCYDKSRREQSIVWQSGAGFRHAAVDAGEGQPGRYKATPIHMTEGGHFDARRIHSAFQSESQAMPREIADYVLRVLETHPNWRTAAKSG